MTLDKSDLENEPVLKKEKQQRHISWNPDVDPETEDRLAFLKLSPQERWRHMMAVVMLTYPGGAHACSYSKRKIEWT